VFFSPSAATAARAEKEGVGGGKKKERRRGRRGEAAAAKELHHTGVPIGDIDVAALPALPHLATATPHPCVTLAIPSLSW
jgi:hypothetical protein